jgi:hypothetical protein
MVAPKGYFSGYINGYLRSNYTLFKASGEFRKPRKGEYFLSGAIVGTHYAQNDIGTEYWIAKPVEMKVCPHCEGHGKVEKE